MRVAKGKKFSVFDRRRKRVKKVLTGDLRKKPLKKAPAVLYLNSLNFGK
jgi:hypothetical protein